MADDDTKLDATYLRTVLNMEADADAVAQLLRANGYFSVAELNAATEDSLVAVGIQRGTAGALPKHGTLHCTTLQTHHSLLHCSLTTR